MKRPHVPHPHLHLGQGLRSRMVIYYHRKMRRQHAEDQAVRVRAKRRAQDTEPTTRSPP